MSKKKYVIESAFENVSVQKIMQLGIDANGRIINWTDSIKNIEELNSDYINEHYGELQDEAYKQGYADAERIWRAPSSNNEFYQKGLEDAWVAVRKIVSMPDDPYWELFGDYKAEIIKNTTVSEVIAKLKAYEEKHSDRIEVGDEVEAAFGTAVVVCCDYDADKASYIYSSGRHGFDNTWNLKKTGKHYDIASILEAMRK